MTKKNSTIIVLTIMLISVFALNSFAFCEIYDSGTLSYVTIVRKLLRGGAPYTQEAVLETTSPTISHKSYVAVGCFTCDDRWKTDVSEYFELSPEDVHAGKTFDLDCWNHQNASDHCAAYYDAILQN